VRQLTFQKFLEHVHCGLMVCSLQDGGRESRHFVCAIRGPVCKYHTREEAHNMQDGERRTHDDDYWTAAVQPGVYSDLLDFDLVV